MSEHQFNIKSEPFSWDDNFSEVALEDFYMIQKNLPYITAQNIGIALGKLKMIEDGELLIDTDGRFAKKSVKNRKLVKDFHDRPLYIQGDCPNCGSVNLKSCDTDYCNACGQALDWQNLNGGM